MNKLKEYFEDNQQLLMHKYMHYFEIYDQHFSRFRDQEICVLEFGVSQGGSLQMWKEYFGKNTKIYGVDINHLCKSLEEDNVEIFIGSQEDRKFLQAIAAKLPKIDILIDDGGHTMEQQIITFEELFPYISENGVYLCEDLHTSYWESFGGGYKNSNSFIEYSKNFIDQLNSWHSREPEKLKVSSFTRSVHSVHYYDSILVIEKRKLEAPFTKITGNRAFGFHDKTSAAKAITRYQKEVELNPSNAQAHTNLANIFSEQGEKEAAIATYQKALELDENPATYYSLGNTQYEFGDIDKAITSYRKAIELNSQRLFCVYVSFVYQRLGDSLKQQNKFNEALHTYQKAIKLGLENSVIYLSLGDVQLKNQDLEGAIASYEQSIELNPDNFIAHKKLGDTLSQQEQYKLSIFAYQNAIDLQPENPHIYCSLANAYCKSGDLKTAIHNYNKSINIDSQFFWIHRNLGDAFKQSKLFKEAANEYQKAIDLEPGNSSLYIILGDVLKEQGEFEPAINTYKKAIDLQLNHPQLQNVMQKIKTLQSLSN